MRATCLSYSFSFLRGSDELPAILPRPAVTDLQRDIQKRHALEDASHHEWAGVDGPEPDRPDELEHLVLGTLIVASHETVETGAAHRRVGPASGERVVECFDDANLGVALLELFGGPGPAQHLTGAVQLAVGGGVHDHLAVH